MPRRPRRRPRRRPACSTWPATTTSGCCAHPDVIAGAVAAAQAYGGGAGASRLVTGTLALHEELELGLARLLQADSALVFSTGYAANLGAVTALTDADTLIVSDAHVHASLIDAARLSRARVVVAPHNDAAAVERLLAERSEPRAVVARRVDLQRARRRGPAGRARRDLAPATTPCCSSTRRTGWASPATTAQGLAAAAGISRLDHVVLTVTLSKSLGAQGGAVLGHPAVREHLVNTAPVRSSTTPGWRPRRPVRALAALRAAASTTPSLAAGCAPTPATLARACGVEAPAGAVLSVPMPGPHEALAAVETCAAHGIRIGCFRPPSTPDGISRLRITAHAHHTRRRTSSRAAKVLADVTGRTTDERHVTGPDRHRHRHRGRQDRHHRGHGRRRCARRACGSPWSRPTQTGLQPGRAGRPGRRTPAGRRRSRRTSCCGCRTRWPPTPPRGGSASAADGGRARRHASPRSPPAPTSTWCSSRAPAGCWCGMDGAGRHHRRPGRRAGRPRGAGRVRRGRDAGPGHAQPQRADRRGAAPPRAGLRRLRDRVLAAQEPDLAMQLNLEDLPAVTGAPLLGRVPDGAGPTTANGSAPRPPPG